MYNVQVHVIKFAIAFFSVSDVTFSVVDMFAFSLGHFNFAPRVSARVQYCRVRSTVLSAGPLLGAEQ